MLRNLLAPASTVHVLLLASVSPGSVRLLPSASMLMAHTRGPALQPFCRREFLIVLARPSERSRASVTVLASVIQLVGFCVLGNEGGYPDSIRSRLHIYTRII